MAHEAQRWWDTNGPSYPADCRIPIGVHYGPGSPTEAELQLLGSVAGTRVLELGCESWQCAYQRYTARSGDVCATTVS